MSIGFETRCYNTHRDVFMELLLKGATQLSLTLTSVQLEQFQCYYQELIAWNRKMNLTAIVEWDEVQIKHFLDSLTPSLVLGDRLNDGSSLLDVGAGGGFPGVPLKILYPKLRLTLLDSVAKKNTFLEHLISELGLSDVDVLTGRAEDIALKPHLRECFDVVVSRGVAPMRILMELTLPFTSVGGQVAVLKKGEIQPEVDNSLHSMEVLGGKLREVRPVEGVEGLEDDRVVVTVDKVRLTPAKFPRRPGLPKKHPL